MKKHSILSMLFVIFLISCKNDNDILQHDDSETRATYSPYLNGPTDVSIGSEATYTLYGYPTSHAITTQWYCGPGATITARTNTTIKVKFTTATTIELYGTVWWNNNSNSANITRYNVTVRDPNAGGNTGGNTGGYYSSITTDYSGQVHVITITEDASGNHPSVKATIPDDYVIIGGGACILGNVEAILTKCYPSSDLKSWNAESKDHNSSECYHTLRVYAIGLKLEGVSSAQLRQNIRLVSSVSAVASHPETKATLPIEYTLIGGGACVNWKGQGNLLVRSIPQGNSWSVKGKDHQKADPSSITAYAIGIKKNISGFGELEIVTESQNSWISAYNHSISRNINQEWLIACPGGEAGFEGQGRFLTSFYPKIGSFISLRGVVDSRTKEVIVSTRDHQKKDSGTTSLHLIKIRKKQ